METSNFRAISDFKERIDFLLDKISAQGIGNLTLDEQKWLDLASQGPENMKKQSERAQEVLKMTFDSFKKEKYITQRGRVVHFLNPITGITLVTVTEIADNVYNLYLRDGFLENIVEKMDNSISIYDVDEYLRVFIRQKFGFNVQKVCEIT